MIIENFACDITHNSDDVRYLTYNELFFKGDDVHHLMADLSSGANCMDEFEEDANMFSAIESVFGYG